MFKLLRRRRPLPADQRPPLERDERVVAWSAVADHGSGPVVVTNRGLWLPEEPGRLGWHQIHKVVWSGRELTVTPARVIEKRDGYALVADRPPRSVALVEPGEVPHQVRTRVTGSVAYSELHPAPGGGGVRVVARRVSGVDGLTWTVRFDPGVALDSPAAREAAADLVAAARASTADPSL